MRFRLLLILTIFSYCNEPRLNNQSEFGTDSYLENQVLLCLTGKISACQAAIPVCTECRFFSTSITYNGNRGGIAGADAICMNDAKKPVEPARAVFKAFLVDDVNRIACTTSDCLTGGVSEHTDWILKANTTYKRAVDGVTIATTNSVGIFSTQPGDAEVSTVNNILTGFFAGGWTTRSSGHCSRWSDGTNAGQVGYTSSNSLFIASGGLFCDTPSIILCVEQ